MLFTLCSCCGFVWLRDKKYLVKVRTKIILWVKTTTLREVTTESKSRATDQAAVCNTLGVSAYKHRNV